MKTKSYIFLLALLPAWLSAWPLLAGPIVPVKIDSGDNTLEVPDTAAFYAANPPDFSQVTGTATVAQMPLKVVYSDLENNFTAGQNFTNGTVSLSNTNLELSAASVRTFAFSGTNIRWRIGTVVGGDSVDGLLVFSGGLPAESGYGTAGQVLATNGTGDGLEWADSAGVDESDIFGGVATATPTGTSQTIDFAGESNAGLDLSSASGDVTLTLANLVDDKIYTLTITQGSTPRDVIFPAGTLGNNNGGGKVNVSTGDGAIDTVTFRRNSIIGAVEIIGINPNLGDDS
ncbi:MAG: hypothetical protein AAGK14_01610 [Verrucomicrobiota bacterium]